MMIAEQNKGMRIILIDDTICAGDKHEMINYPREGFKPKPALRRGTILEVKEEFRNLYGYYYRCVHENGTYDIPKRNAEPYITDVWVVSWPIGRPTRPILVSEKFYSEEEAIKFAEAVKAQHREYGAFAEAEQVRVYKEVERNE